jgi:type IV secretion system protein VirB6
MGMATYIEQSVNNALNHYVVTSSDAVIGVLTPIAVTAMTLYVMWTGFQVMRGDVQEPVTALVWRWFRVALITGLTLNGPQYRSLVKEGLDGIQEAFASAFGGVLSMGGTIDQMADPFTTLMETLFTEASSGLVPQFSLFIAGGICATASIVMAFVAMGLFLVAKVSLALLLAVGPAFIFCAMFPVTQRYAENWLSSSLVAVFTNILIMAVITFLASLLRNACLHVLIAYSAASILADVVGLLFLSITAAYVLLHVASLGASLAGGLSLGNPGGDVTRSGMLFVHSVTSGLSRFVPLALASTGGSLSGPRTGTARTLLSALRAENPQPGSDLYQRASLERLRNSVSRKE